MKKLAIMLLFGCSQAMGQSGKMILKKTVEVEVDPIAYVLKGYSLHAIYMHNRFRYDWGFFGIEPPAGLTGNKDFAVRTTGFGLKVNYLLQGVKGAYVGLDAGHATNTVSNTKTGWRDIGHNASIGAHLGYRFFLFPRNQSALAGLYLTPWAGLSYNLHYDKVKLDGYKETPLGYFATFHIGYRF